MMAASRSFQSFIIIALAAIGAELGIYLAGAHWVPVIDTALRTFDPPLAVLWVAAGLVHASSAITIGWVAARVGQQIGRRVSKPASAIRADNAKAPLFSGISAAA